MPEWWFYYWFGTVNLTDATLDTQGKTLLSDYQNYTNGVPVDPNVISFTFRLKSQVNTTNATGSYQILGGVPSYEAVLANSTNFAAATWQPYDGNISLTLGPTDGVYQVWLGLKGFAAAATPTWNGTEVTLNRNVPQITITSPATNVVAQPWLQLQGCSALPLAGVTFDISNSVAVLTNQLGNIIAHTVDTNTSSYTTDYFQCFDIRLASGTNAITLHATDPAGNSTNIALNSDWITVA